MSLFHNIALSTTLVLLTILSVLVYSDAITEQRKLQTKQDRLVKEGIIRSMTSKVNELDVNKVKKDIKEALNNLTTGSINSINTLRRKDGFVNLDELVLQIKHYQSLFKDSSGRY